MRDPSIARAPDGTFHMVWAAGRNERGIGYASSRDLVNSSPQRYIPVMEHAPDARNSWAPELFYDPERGEYLIIPATTIPGRFPETDGQDAGGPNRRYGVVVSDDLRSWTDESDKLRIPEGMRHGTALEVPGAAIAKLLRHP